MSDSAGLRRVGADAAKVRALGEALSKLRRARRLSQRAAGARVGVSAQAWGKYERGQCPGIVSPATIEALEKALTCEPGSLLAACTPRSASGACAVREIPGGYEIALDLTRLRRHASLVLRIEGASL